jgi:hypothetical protein
MTAATPGDLAQHLGVELDDVRAQYLLDAARDMIVALTGRVADAWPAGVQLVQVTAAARAYANPAEKTQEAIGSRSYTVRNVGIYLTPDERAMLKAAVGRGGLVSVPLVQPGEIYPRPDIVA